jgi:Zn-dependent protease
VSDPGPQWPPPEASGPSGQQPSGNPSNWYYPPGSRPIGTNGTSSGGPQGPAPRRPAAFGASRLVWIVVAIALVLALRSSHHITSGEIILFCVIVPSIILHEIAHGWVALAFGDDTAKRAGRLTLNPLAHIDIFGTIILPVLLIFGGYGFFGWAKPVPVNLSKLRSPRNQGVLVSLAGPATNVVLATIALVIFRLDHGFTYYGAFAGVFAEIVFYFGFVNVWLALFNMLPIPPLDGSVLIERMLPAAWWPGYLRFRRFALPLLVVVVLISSSIGSGGGLLDRFSNNTLYWWAHLLGLPY